MIKDCCMLIALSLNQSIPLRVAITQGDIKCSTSPGRQTLSGSGWERLKELEGMLDWMGGFLYLPVYDGSHHSTIQKLIQTTFLVRQQHSAKYHFIAPFQKTVLNEKYTWFLNWQKCLNLEKDPLDVQINHWWNRYSHSNLINEYGEVRKKQNNTIIFADYCRLLREAANLLYFSEVDKTIPIGEINKSCY
ncbi:MAG: hypothetical protein ACFFA0_07810, partial [Promethearchaeota archaeon]